MKKYIIMLLVLVICVVMMTGDAVSNDEKVRSLLDAAPSVIGIRHEIKYDEVIRTLGKPKRENYRPVTNIHDQVANKDIVYILEYDSYAIELFQSGTLDKYFIISLTITDPDILLPYNIRIGCNRDQVRNVLGIPDNEKMFRLKYLLKEYTYWDIEFVFGLFRLKK